MSRDSQPRSYAVADEESPPSPEPLAVQSTPLYNLQPAPLSDQANVQMWLAFVLIGLIALVVVTSCAAFLLRTAGVSDIREFTLAMLGPVGSLAGTIIGFYFGERRGSAARRPR